MATVDIFGEALSGTTWPNVGTNVFVKSAWGDDWTFIPYIQVNECEDAAAPAVGRATASYDFGDVFRGETRATERFLQLYINGGFVKIEVWTKFSTSLLWMGEIAAETVNPFGTAFAAGAQAFTAFDLKHVLDRIDIRGSWVESDDPLVPIFIDKTLVFNKVDGRGVGLQGNRSAAKDSSGAFFFSSDGEIWTYHNILEYIVVNFANTDEFPVLIEGAALDALDGIISEVDPDRFTVKSALDMLITPQRGLGWTITPTDDGIVHAHVYSAFPNELALDTITVPANTEQDIVKTDSLAIVQPVVNFSALEVFEKIIAEGGVIRSTCTLSFADLNLEEGWVAALEILYRQGTGVEDDAASHNDAARKADKFAAVYQRFNVKEGWNGLTGDGAGNGVARPIPPVPDTFPPYVEPAPTTGKVYFENALPVCDDHGIVSIEEIEDLANFHRPALRFDKQTGLAADDEEAASGTDEFRPMFAMVQVPDPNPVAQTITSSTDVTPPIVLMGEAHGLDSNDEVEITGHLVNLAVNGTRLVTVLSPTTFSLQDTDGVDITTTGAGAGSGGTMTPQNVWMLVDVLDAIDLPRADVKPLDKDFGIRIRTQGINHAGALNHWIPPDPEGDPDPVPQAITSSTDVTPPVVLMGAAHGLSSGDQVEIAGHLVNVAVNGTRLVTVLSPTTFSIQDTLGVDVVTTGAGAGSGGTMTPEEFIVIQPADTGIEPEWDYETMSVTAQFATHERIKYEAGNTDVSDLGVERIKRISMPDAEVWVVIPNTITDIVDGKPVRASELVTVRDDTARLKLVAEMAAAWYGTPKATLDLQLAWIFQTNPTGSMITGMLDGSGLTLVNSVVTMRRWIFDPARGVTTTFQTGQANMKFTGFVGTKIGTTRKIQNLEGRVGKLETDARGNAR